MTDLDILDSFRRKVCHEIDIEREGTERYVVYTPFMFDDGDHYVIVLNRERGQWVLTDEGHTLMHLSYSGTDLSRGIRAKLIDQALDNFGLEARCGEIRLPVPDEQFGDALFSYLQAIGRVSSTALWTQHRVKSTFLEDFRDFVQSAISSERLSFDYHDPHVDPDEIYPIDCCINGMPTPYFVFAIGTTDKCRNATITCLTYERRQRPFRSVAIFEDQTTINRKAVAQLTDVIGKAFSSLGDRDRIQAYFREALAEH